MVADLHTCVVTRDELLRHYDPVRIQGYCVTCPQYGQYWSCPPFENPPLAAFPPWDHAVLVLEKVATGPDLDQARVMARFHEARRGFRSLLLSAELKEPGTTALVAGYCQGCQDCSRGCGKECTAPSERRYSLESVGFDVTGVAEGLGGVKVLWPKSGMPEYLLTAGALLCQGSQRARRLEGALR